MNKVKCERNSRAQYPAEAPESAITSLDIFECRFAEPTLPRELLSSSSSKSPVSFAGSSVPWHAPRSRDDRGPAARGSGGSTCCSYFFFFFSFLCCLLPPLLRFLFLRHLCFCFLILVLHLRHYCLLLFLPSSSSSSSSPTSSFFFSLPLFPPLSDNLSLSGILRSPPPPPQAQRLVPHATTRILLASYTPSSLYDRSGHDVRVPPASSPTDAPNAFTVSPPTDRPPSHPFPFRQQVGFASTEDPDLRGSRVRRVFGLSLDAATGSREDCVHLKVFITLVKRVI